MPEQSDISGAVIEDGEADLVVRAQRGSAEAFTRLMELHQGRVRAYLTRFVRQPELIDDLAQDVFLSAYRKLASYSHDAPIIRWLMSIARNRAMTWLRDEGVRLKHRDRQLDAQVSQWMLEGLENREPDFEDVETQTLKQCIEELNPKGKQLVRLHYFEDIAPVDIARMLGRKHSTVRMTLLRIRRALAECVRKHLPEIDA